MDRLNPLGSRPLLGPFASVDSENVLGLKSRIRFKLDSLDATCAREHSFVRASHHSDSNRGPSDKLEQDIDRLLKQATSLGICKRAEGRAHSLAERRKLHFDQLARQNELVHSTRPEDVADNRQSATSVSVFPHVSKCELCSSVKAQGAAKQRIHLTMIKELNAQILNEQKILEGIQADIARYEKSLANCESGSPPAPQLDVSVSIEEEGATANLCDVDQALSAPTSTENCAMPVSQRSGKATSFIYSDNEPSQIHVPSSRTPDFENTKPPGDSCSSMNPVSFRRARKPPAPIPLRSDNYYLQTSNRGYSRHGSNVPKPH